MKHLLFIGIATIALVGIPALKASDENPDKTKDHVSSIRWVIARDKDDDISVDQRYVVLVGKVTKKIHDDTYIFSDGTGKIQLDSDVKLPVGETIAIRGEIDQAFLGIGDLEVDVQSFRHVK